MMTTPLSKLVGDEIERAKLHGPDLRTLDALESTLERAQAAERDFIQVHKNCIEAREALAQSQKEVAELREALKDMLDDYCKALSESRQIGSVVDKARRALKESR